MPTPRPGLGRGVSPGGPGVARLWGADRTIGGKKLNTRKTMFASLRRIGVIALFGAAAAALGGCMCENPDDSPGQCLDYTIQQIAQGTYAPPGTQ